MTNTVNKRLHLAYIQGAYQDTPSEVPLYLDMNHITYVVYDSFELQDLHIGMLVCIDDENLHKVSELIGIKVTTVIDATRIHTGIEHRPIRPTPVTAYDPYYHSAHPITPMT